MRIENVEPLAVRLPLVKPVKMASETIETADNVLVRIDAGGETGWGEAASAPTLTGETVESTVAAIRYLTPYLLGADARELDEILAEMDARLYGNSGAKAAIDIALHDLIGRATGTRVCELLAAPRREWVSVLWMLGTGQTEPDVAEATARRREGFTAFKIKVALNEPAYDVARTRAICEALGAGCLISADANQGWTEDEAVHYAASLAGTGLDFIEQPVHGRDLEGMARVAAASPIVVCADEGIHGLDDLRRHHERRAARGVSLKCIKFGGVRRVYEAAAVCEALGLRVNLAGTVAESSIATAALLHLAAILPTLEWGVSPTNQYLAADVVEARITAERGRVAIPRGPGLGVSVDAAKVDAHRLPSGQPIRPGG